MLISSPDVHQPCTPLIFPLVPLHLITILGWTYSSNSYKPLPRILKRQLGHFLVIRNTLYRRSHPQHRKVLFTKDLPLIFHSLHDSMGHFGIDTLWNFVRTRYWKPFLYRDCKRYVQSCDTCQRYQYAKPKYAFDGKSAQSGLFRSLLVDYAGPFPKTTSGHTYILFAIEPFSHWPFALACDSASAAHVVKLLTNEVIPLFGCPEYLLSDRGSHFQNTLIGAVSSAFGITQVLSPPYTPEWTSNIERFIGTFKHSLYKMVNHARLSTSEWDLFLTSILFAYRMRPLTPLRHSPFQLLFGIPPRLPIDNQQPPNPLRYNYSVRSMEIDALWAYRHSLLADAIASSTVPTFAIGSLVLLLDPQLRKPNFKYPAFKPRYTGPFKVESILPHNFYTLLNNTNSIVSKSIHCSRLIAYQARGLEFVGVGSVISK